MGSMTRWAKKFSRNARYFGDKMLASKNAKLGIIGGGAGLFLASRMSDNSFIRGVGDVGGLAAAGAGGYWGARKFGMTKGWSGVSRGGKTFMGPMRPHKLINFSKTGGHIPEFGMAAKATTAPYMPGAMRRQKLTPYIGPKAPGVPGGVAGARARARAAGDAAQVTAEARAKAEATSRYYKGEAYRIGSRLYGRGGD